MEEAPLRRGLYMPVLRAKPSEWFALAHMAPAPRRRLLPLLELTPDAFAIPRPTKREQGQSAQRLIKRPEQIARVAIRNFAECAAENAARGRLIVDVAHCGTLDFTPYGISIWKELFRLWVPGTRGIVPTVRLRWKDSVHDVACGLVSRLNAGACLRLTAQDLVRADLSAAVARILKLYELPAGSIDLVVDFENDPHVLNYVTLARRIPLLSEWRTYTVVAGVFPVDLTDFDPEDTPETHSRLEWSTWWAQVNQTPNNALRATCASRLPQFGDFTTYHGKYVPARQSAGSYSIRYTDDLCYWIYRGYKANTDLGRTGNQFLGHARMLCSSGHFFGEQFSNADAFIYSKAQVGVNSGSAKQWRSASVIHHMHTVLAQLDAPDGTSTHARASAAAQQRMALAGPPLSPLRRSAHAAQRAVSTARQRRRRSE